jgi:hypothetical protein
MSANLAFRRPPNKDSSWPLTPQQVAMPAQDPIRSDEQTESSATRLGHQTDQQRDGREIRPIRSRTLCRGKLALQDGKLVTQQQDLDGLVVLVASAKSKCGDDADGQNVDEAYANKAQRSHRPPIAITNGIFHLTNADEVLGKDRPEASARTPKR